jgi:hypothetical protein
MGLIEYWALRYFARLPTHHAETGSLSLCIANFLWLPSHPTVSQWRTCHSDHLPLNQGDSGFFQPDGFASFAGQTKNSAASYRVLKQAQLFGVLFSGIKLNQLVLNIFSYSFFIGISNSFNEVALCPKFSTPEITLSDIRIQFEKFPS